MFISPFKLRIINRRFLSYLFISILFLSSVYTISSFSNSGLAISMSLVGNEAVYAPGDTVYIITEIRNSQASGRVDVIVSYQILKKGVVVLTESTTVAIETLSSFSRDLKLPESLSSDSYVLKTSASSLDGEQYTEAIKSIDVLKVSENGQLVIEYVMGFSLIGTLGALFYEHRRISKIKLGKVDLERYIKQKK